MQLYLYSVQDLIVEDSSNALHKIEAGDFYGLEMDKNEVIKVYPIQNAGVMLLEYGTLYNCKHNQIIYHNINNEILLCEFKPLISFENAKQYVIKGASVRIVQYSSEMYVYLNGMFYGCVKQKCGDVRFEKLDKNNQEYIVVYSEDGTITLVPKIEDPFSAGQEAEYYEKDEWKDLTPEGREIL